MALIDKASLLMVPSTYEAGTLYNVLPSGNRAPDSTDQNSGYDQTRADFTFDRGSNAAATRVNASGLIEKYRENILLRSNDFDTTWTDFSGASAQSGYDGNSNAWRYDSSSSALRLQQVGISISGVKTYSIYAKYVDAQWFSLQIDGASTEAAWFDIQNGTLGTTTNAIDSKIEAVGTDGWYRCSVTGSVDSQNRVRLYVVGSDGSSTTITGSIYIQDAQLESGLVASSYLESTSVTGKAGVLVDLPRINYDANGENGALLLEPSRANLLQFSEYFGASYWTKSGASVVSGFTSPEGLGNSYKLIEDTSTGFHRINKNTISVSSATTYIISVYAKKGERTKFGIQDGQSSLDYATFDLEEGTLIEASRNGSSITPLSNGWYRCSVEILTTITSVQSAFYILDDAYTTGQPNATSYTGDGSSGVLIYGAQLELGSYSSSYIPTMGTSETRAADSCSVTGASDVIGQTEGTIFWDVQIDTPVATANEAILNLDGGFFGNTIYLSKSATGNITGEMYVSGGSSQSSFTLVGISAGSYKIAFAYAQNNTAMFVNGVQVGSTDTSCNVPATSRIQLGNTALGPSTDLTKQVILFNERLSNAELAALTA